jgi:hypothetical protein
MSKSGRGNGPGCSRHGGGAERLSAGTAGAGVSVETGWRLKVTESMADRAAPAVVQPRLVRLSVVVGDQCVGVRSHIPCGL